jgi:hypothetical protein
VVIEETLTLADLERAKNVPVRPLATAEAFDTGLRAADEFLKWCVTPFLDTLTVPSLQEQALVSLHHRIRGFLRTALALPATQYVQSLVAAARSGIELYVDMKLLDGGLIEDGLKKFWYFTDTQRLKAARRITEFYLKHPDLRSRPLDQLTEYIKEFGPAIDERTGQLWGIKKSGAPKAPAHWSGLNLRARARLVSPECEDLVIDGYDYRNWLVHSGASGIAGLSRDTLEVLSATSLRALHRAALGSIEILASRLRLSVALDGFNEQFHVVEHVPDFVLADLQLRSLGEPQRVRVRFIKDKPGAST